MLLFSESGILTNFIETLLLFSADNKFLHVSCRGELTLHINVKNVTYITQETVNLIEQNRLCHYKVS